MKKTVNITKEGKKKLEEELERLIAERPIITQKIATARAFGDLSENEEYSSARNEQKLAESRIFEIEDILKNAKIIQSGASHGKVTMGSVVTVEFNGKKQEYAIVGPVEADPLSGKISNESPLGKVIFGRKVGETVTLETPKGEVEYKILEIK